MAHDTKAEFQLPLSLVTIVDLSRTRRELAAVDEFMLQASVRKTGARAQLPKTSHALEEMVRANGYNLLEANDRTHLIEILTQLQKKAPTIHMSFAVDPPAAALNRLITWLRQEIHPQLLLQVGLQPSIAAGCIVRTGSKYFDFSLRKHFETNEKLLLTKLHEGVV